jgi:predicted anti-sigma-YlaC factor YlaD
MEAEYQGGACTKYEALLEDLMNGELNGADSAPLAEHMRDCAGCRSAFKDAAACARLLQQAEPTADPGPNFAHLVMTRIRAAREAAEPKSIWQPFVSMAWKFAATAAMVLAVLVTFDVRGHHLVQDDASMMAQSESRDLLNSDPSTPPRSADDVLILMADSNHGQY